MTIRSFWKRSGPAQGARPVNAVAYIRHSVEPNDPRAEVSVRDQAADCVAWCERAGLAAREAGDGR